MMNVTPNDRYEGARMGPGMSTPADDARLVRLGESGVSGEAGGPAPQGRHPDIRGWPVVAADGRRLGRVHDVLLDARSHRVRWLDVEMDRAAVRAREARCVLLPVGAARMDDARRQVRLPSLTGADAARLPGCGHGPLSREREQELLTHLARPAPAPADLPDTGAAAETDFYDQPHFSDAEFWGRS
ncbi:MAG TPA: PRC-barrel domain-containing protein [Gemmatimonadales bacterium]